jgi:TfoX/Sxy family transcriptional regulator of competence genes
MASGQEGRYKMAYDELLAVRIRAALAGEPDLAEKKMFGGVCYLVSGNMACGVIKDELIVRVGPEGHAAAMALPHTRPFDFTGRPMNGWVMVAGPAFATEAELKAWLRLGVDFAKTLPPKVK